jgi:hypothetical protein
MANKKLTCPICESDENTYKVSEIYVQSLARLKSGDNTEAPIIDALQKEIPEERRDKLKGTRYYRELMESFAPPQGGTTSTRAVNPDWVAFALGILTIYILYQIFVTQRWAFWYMIAFTVVAYAAYFFFRKQIFAKYQTQRSEEVGTKGIVEKAVGYWMKLYYCAKDNTVFGANKEESVPISDMRAYLLDLARKK